MAINIIPFPKPTFIEEKWICYKCKEPISIRINKERRTELCGCGCLIHYFSKPHRPYGMRTFIGKSEFNKEKIMEKERESLINEAKARGIDIKRVAKTDKFTRNLLYEPTVKETVSL